MVVSQQDWIQWKSLTIWSRFSLLMVVLILLVMILMSVKEYYQLNTFETFTSCILPLQPSKEISFPLQFIIPKEYLSPGITKQHLMDRQVSIQNAISTRNRFIQAILQNNVRLPILSSVTETVALEDVSRQKDSCTICSANTLSKYMRANPKSKLSVLDVVDTLYVYIIVSSTSDIFTIRDLKGKSILTGLSGSASNDIMHTLSKSLRWKQNKDYVVNESTPNSELIRRSMGGRNPQVDATILVDVYPSPLVQSVMQDESNQWRLISIPNSPTSRWNVNAISYSQLNQQNNKGQINILMTPLLMVSNSEYRNEDLLKFTSFAKNPFILYGLQQVIDTYSLPLHPTSYNIYKNLGLLS